MRTSQDWDRSIRTYAISICMWVDWTKVRMRFGLNHLLPSNYPNLPELFRSKYWSKLFPLAEKFPDASVGPTFARIIGIQLYGLKFGDRYFYSHGYQAGSFTPDQLLNIKEVSSFAHLLCKNADNIKSIQLNPFLPASRQNYEIPCSSLPDINFNLFKS